MKSKSVLIDGKPGKRCSKCNRELLLSEFYPKPSNSDGFSGRCKECLKKINNDHYHTKLKHDPEFNRKGAAYRKAWHLHNYERRRAMIRDNHRKQRLLCIQHYGGKCECCGESRMEFMALDHVDGGGHQHRKQIGGKLARWLVRNNFPDKPKLRVLCHNCNMAIAFYGSCPHQNKAEACEQHPG